MLPLRPRKSGPTIRLVRSLKGLRIRYVVLMSSPSSKFFGISVQNTLLVVALVGLAVVALPYWIDDIAQQVVYNHELLDLGDETRARGWAILDTFDSLRRDTAVLARSCEEDSGLESAEAKRTLDDMRKRYLRIEIRPLSAPAHAGGHPGENLGGWSDWMPELDQGQREIL